MAPENSQLTGHTKYMSIASNTALHVNLCIKWLSGLSLSENKDVISYIKHPNTLKTDRVMINNDFPIQRNWTGMLN